MIGLSVSFCVRDIASGKVSIDDVEKIIAGTCVSTPEHWEEVIKSYMESYWSFGGQESTPEACEQICRQLLAEGKIEQPRLADPPRCPSLAGRSAWVSSEAEIMWG